jgi:hypothetical protein
MLVVYSMLLILLLQTNLLIGHESMTENDRVAMPSFPVFWPHDRADCSYNNLLSKQGSFPRTLWTSKYFELLNFSASRSRFRIPRAVETERYLFFLGKRIATLSFAAPIRLGTTVRLRSHHFRPCLFAFCFTVSFSFLLHGQHLCPPSYFSQCSVDQRRRLRVQLGDGECHDGDFVFSDPWHH